MWNIAKLLGLQESWRGTFCKDTEWQDKGEWLPSDHTQTFAEPFCHYPGVFCIPTEMIQNQAATGSNSSQFVCGSKDFRNNTFLEQKSRQMVKPSDLQNTASFLTRNVQYKQMYCHLKILRWYFWQSDDCRGMSKFGWGQEWILHPLKTHWWSNWLFDYASASCFFLLGTWFARVCLFGSGNQFII